MLAGMTQVHLFIILGTSFMEILSEINLLKNAGDIKSCWCLFGTDKNYKLSCSLTEFEGKLYPPAPPGGQQCTPITVPLRFVTSH